MSLTNCSFSRCKIFNGGCAHYIHTKHTSDEFNASSSRAKISFCFVSLSTLINTCSFLRSTTIISGDSLSLSHTETRRQLLVKLIEIIMSGQEDLVRLDQIIIKDLLRVGGFVPVVLVAPLTQLITAQNQLDHPRQRGEQTRPRVQTTDTLQMRPVDLVRERVAQAFEDQRDFLLEFARVDVVWVEL
jgi:hypothetical protein